MARTGRLAMRRGLDAGRRRQRATDVVADDTSTRTACRSRPPCGPRARLRERRSHSGSDLHPASCATGRAMRFEASRRTPKQTMAKMYYDKDADLSPDPGQEGRRHRLRLAGARPRAEPGRQRRPGARGPARRAAGRPPRPGRRPASRCRSPTPRPGPTSSWCSRPTPSRPRSTVDAIAPHLARRQAAAVRPRLQHPLRHDHAARQRRRGHGRAQVARPPRARSVRRGRRHARAGCRPPGCDRPGPCRWRCRTPRPSASPARA